MKKNQKIKAVPMAYRTRPLGAADGRAALSFEKPHTKERYSPHVCIPAVCVRDMKGLVLLAMHWFER
jgi:hypothetical protein